MTKAKASYTIAKPVTLPHLKLKLDTPFHLQVTSPFVQAKEQEKYAAMTAEEKAKDSSYKEPPHLCDVVDLDTGECAQIIGNKVLRGILEDNYPENGYVGMGFQIIMHAKKSGKNYHTFTVHELTLNV